MFRCIYDIYRSKIDLVFQVLDNTFKSKLLQTDKDELDIPNYALVIIKLVVSNIKSPTSDQTLGTLVYGDTIIYDTKVKNSSTKPIINITADIPAFTYWAANLAEEIRSRDIKIIFYSRIKEHKFAHPQMVNLLLESDTSGVDVKILFGCGEKNIDLIGNASSVLFFEHGLAFVGKRLGACSLPFSENLSAINVFLDNNVSGYKDYKIITIL